MNQTEAATLLGVDPRVIRSYSKLTPPIPVSKSNATHTDYNGPDIVKWFVEYEIGKYKNSQDYSTEDRKKLQDREQAAKTEQREIELALVKGELVYAKDVEIAWTDLVMTIKRIMLNMPHKLAMSIDDGLTYDEKKLKATLLVEEVLKYLANNSSGEYAIG